MVLSVRYNNPGNLRDVGSAEGFRRFSTPQEGLDAMRQDLYAKVSGKSNAMAGKYGQGYVPNLQNILAVYAPDTENDTSNYVKFVADKAGVDPTQPLSETDLDKIIPAMVEMEGGKEAVNYFYGEKDQSTQEKPQFTKEQIQAEIEKRSKPTFTKEQIQAEIQKRKNADTFTGRVKEDYVQREENIEEIKQRTRSGQQTKIEGGFQEAGQAAGMGLDIAGEAAVSAFRALPDPLEKAIRSGAQGALNIAGKLPSYGGGTLGERIPQEIGALAQQYGEFAEQNPRVAGNIEAGANILAVSPARTAVEGALTAAQKVPKQMNSVKFGILTDKPDNAMKKVVERLRKDYPDDAEFYKKLEEFAVSEDMSISDIAGKNTTNLAKGAAQYPSGEAMAETFLTERLTGLPSRVKKAAATYIHNDKDFYNTVDDILEKGRAQAKPLYDKAYKGNKAIVSKEVDNVLDTPAGRKALKDAARVMQNDRSIMGLPDPELKAIQRDLSAIGKMDEVKGKIASGLNLRTLDAVKKNLDDQVGKLYRDGDNYEAGVLNNLKKDLVDALDEADVTGAYKKARERSGDYLRVTKAIENGRDFMKTDADLIKKYMKDLTPAEKDAFKIGVVRRVRDARINEILDVADFKISGRLDSNKDMMGRLKSILTEDEFNAFKKEMVKEERLIKFRNSVLGGSPTTSKAIAAADLESGVRQMTEIAAEQGFIALARRSVVNTIRKTFDGIGDKTAEKISKVLYETDPQKKLEILRQIQKTEGDDAIKVYFNISDEVRKLRAEDTAIAAGAAKEAD